MTIAQILADPRAVAEQRTPDLYGGVEWTWIARLSRNCAGIPVFVLEVWQGGRPMYPVKVWSALADLEAWLAGWVTKPNGWHAAHPAC